MINLFLDILDDQRKSVFQKLSVFGKTAMLGGGTALALQIGHRRSFDFDLFIEKPISSVLYREIQEVFGEAPEKLVDTADQLTVKLHSGIDITFLHYWYKPLYSTVATGSVSLFDIRDIATDKAFTLGRRNVWRDYVDFFFLLKDHHITLEQLIVDARQRFGNEFSPKLFLEQLVFTEDVNDFVVTFVGESFPREEINAYLASEVKQYAEANIVIKSS